jgi:hypothetical protein
MAPQSFENIDSAPGNGMGPEASTPLCGLRAARLHGFDRDPDGLVHGLVVVGGRYDEVAIDRASKLQTQHVLEQRPTAEHAVRDVVGKQDPTAASWLVIGKRIELNDALDPRFLNVNRFDFDRSGAANR